MVGRTERRRDLSQLDLAILIVAYNCRDDIDEALASIDEAEPALRYEIVVIDNDSSDGIVDHLRLDDRVTVVEMGANTGFSRANNAGIAATSARNILFLNPDTVVRPGALETMVAFLDEHPDAGVVAPKLLNTDLTDQGTARAFPSPAAAVFGRRSPLTRLYPDNPWAKRYMTGRDQVGDAPFAIEWVSGACLMTTRRVVEVVGPLDEDFFMHWEDAEFCHRVKRHGYGVWCTPTARVVHHEGGSRQGWPVRQVWHFHHGAYLYWCKHHATSPWHPLRYVAGAALLVRAGLIIVRDTIMRVAAGNEGDDATSSR